MKGGGVNGDNSHTDAATAVNEAVNKAAEAAATTEVEVGCGNCVEDEGHRVQEVVVMGGWRNPQLHWQSRALQHFGGNSGVMFDEGGYDTTSGLDTEGKRGNVEKEQVLGLLGGVDGGLDIGTIGDGLVRVDALVGLLAVEEVRHELDDTGGYEPCRS